MLPHRGPCLWRTFPFLEFQWYLRSTYASHLYLLHLKVHISTKISWHSFLTTDNKIWKPAGNISKESSISHSFYIVLSQKKKNQLYKTISFIQHTCVPFQSVKKWSLSTTVFICSVFFHILCFLSLLESHIGRCEERVKQTRQVTEHKSLELRTAALVWNNPWEPHMPKRHNFFFFFNNRRSIV